VPEAGAERGGWNNRLLDVSTAMIYTHVFNRGLAGVRSPVDRMFLA
jgi:hypothetical protein